MPEMPEMHCNVLTNIFQIMCVAYGNLASKNNCKP